MPAVLDMLASEVWMLKSAAAKVTMSSGEGQRNCLFH